MAAIMFNKTQNGRKLSLVCSVQAFHIIYSIFIGGILLLVCIIAQWVYGDKKELNNTNRNIYIYNYICMRYVLYICIIVAHCIAH